MAKTYLLIGEEQRGPYSEEEVRGFFAAGTITVETLCWKEGMSGWQVLGPISEPSAGDTIAPPRRKQQTEMSKTYVPVDYREKPPKGKTLSARVKPITLFNAIGLLVLFFIVLSILIFVFGHTIPDLNKEFKEMVGE